MKKISKSFFVLCWACLLFSLAGCGATSSNGGDREGGRIKVLSTTAMIGDIVKEIGGDRIEHACLIMGEMDPHSYELVKGDDEKIAFADLVVASGLNLEHGASVRYHLEKHPHVVYLGDHIRKMLPAKILVVGGEIDPHLWMDIALWSEGIAPTVEALSSCDPEGAPFYAERGSILKEKLLSAHSRVKEMLAKIPEERRYLVTSHDAFHYFAKAYLSDVQKDGPYAFIRSVAPEGLAPDGQLGSLDIKRVVTHLSTFKIETIFAESNVSQDALRKIVSSCGHSVQIWKAPLYGDAMGAFGSGAESYLGMIEHNAKVLQEAWTAKIP